MKVKAESRKQKAEMKTDKSDGAKAMESHTLPGCEMLRRRDGTFLIRKLPTAEQPAEDQWFSVRGHWPIQTVWEHLAGVRDLETETRTNKKKARVLNWQRWFTGPPDPKAKTQKLKNKHDNA